MPGRLSMLAVAAMVLSTVAAHGQSTWSGLRFGMSKDDAMETLKKRGMMASVESSDVMTVKPSYQVNLPDLAIPLSFDVELTFSKGGLQQIDLNLKTDELLKSVKSVYALADAANNSMKKALTAKYGKPIEADGACNAESSELVETMFNGDTSCKESWQSQGQLISVSWWYSKQRNRLVYIASYQAPSPDL